MGYVPLFLLVRFILDCHGSEHDISCSRLNDLEIDGDWYATSAKHSIDWSSIITGARDRTTNQCIPTTQPRGHYYESGMLCDVQTLAFRRHTKAQTGCCATTMAPPSINNNPIHVYYATSYEDLVVCSAFELTSTSYLDLELNQNIIYDHTPAMNHTLHCANPPDIDSGCRIADRTENDLQISFEISDDITNTNITISQWNEPLHQYNTIRTEHMTNELNKYHYTSKDGAFNAAFNHQPIRLSPFAHRRDSNGRLFENCINFKSLGYHSLNFSGITIRSRASAKGSYHYTSGVIWHNMNGSKAYDKTDVLCNKKRKMLWYSGSGSSSSSSADWNWYRKRPWSHSSSSSSSGSGHWNWHSSSSYWHNRNHWYWRHSDSQETTTQPPTKVPTTYPPSFHPTHVPTHNPTPVPTKFPSSFPSRLPSWTPSYAPTSNPTDSPTRSPLQDDETYAPTPNPTRTPSVDPTLHPSLYPTLPPTTKPPSFHPTNEPTTNPTDVPTVSPTVPPSNEPTSNPTYIPTSSPTISPTVRPTLNPTYVPTIPPTMYPTSNPTYFPTYFPTISPTIYPTPNPTYVPTNSPTKHPTLNPTYFPTYVPTISPTMHPTPNPTNEPTPKPTRQPTPSPSRAPIRTDETHNPTRDPTREPTIIPTSNPTPNPTFSPTTEQPTPEPTVRPTDFPTDFPTWSPTVIPTRSPSASPLTLVPTSTLREGICCNCTDARLQAGCPSDTACESIICNIDSFCCDSEIGTWDQSCVDGVEGVDNAPGALDICINGTREPSNTPSASPTVSPTEIAGALELYVFYNESRHQYWDESAERRAEYAKYVQSAIWLSYENMTGYSLDYEDKDLHWTQAWNHAGITDWIACFLFQHELPDHDASSNCPYYDDVHRLMRESQFVSVNEFHIVSDQNIGAFKRYIMKQLESNTFLDYVDDLLDALIGLATTDADGNRRVLLQEEGDRTEVIAIHVVDKSNMNDTESITSTNVPSVPSLSPLALPWTTSVGGDHPSTSAGAAMKVTDEPIGLSRLELIGIIAAIVSFFILLMAAIYYVFCCGPKRKQTNGYSAVHRDEGGEPATDADTDADIYADADGTEVVGLKTTHAQPQSTQCHYLQSDYLSASQKKEVERTRRGTDSVERKERSEEAQDVEREDDEANKEDNANDESDHEVEHGEEEEVSIVYDDEDNEEKEDILATSGAVKKAVKELNEKSLSSNVTESDGKNVIISVNADDEDNKLTTVNEETVVDNEEWKNNVNVKQKRKDIEQGGNQRRALHKRKSVETLKDSKMVRLRIGKYEAMIKEQADTNDESEEPS